MLDGNWAIGSFSRTHGRRLQGGVQLHGIGLQVDHDDTAIAGRYQLLQQGRQAERSLASAAIAQKMRVQLGDEVKLLGSSKGIVRLNVVGIVAPADGSSGWLLAGIQQMQ